MDTILNLGLNDETVLGLARLTNNERFAWDSYRRFITMFSDVVLGISKDEFEKVLDEVKEKEHVKYDAEVSAEGLKEVALKSKELFKKSQEILSHGCVGTAFSWPLRQCSGHGTILAPYFIGNLTTSLTTGEPQ